MKVLGKSLSHLENPQSTPPFLQLYFFKRLILEEDWRNSFIIPGKAFCGNGFIHLNMGEFTRKTSGARKHVRILAIRAQYERFLTCPMIRHLILLSISTAWSGPVPQIIGQTLGGCGARPLCPAFLWSCAGLGLNS